MGRGLTEIISGETDFVALESQRLSMIMETKAEDLDTASKVFFLVCALAEVNQALRAVIDSIEVMVLHPTERNQDASMVAYKAFLRKRQCYEHGLQFLPVVINNG